MQNVVVHSSELTLYRKELKDLITALRNCSALVAKVLRLFSLNHHKVLKGHG